MRNSGCTTALLMLQSYDKVYQIIFFMRFYSSLFGVRFIQQHSTQCIFHWYLQPFSGPAGRVSWLLKLSCLLCFLLLLVEVCGPGLAGSGRASGTRSHLSLECVPACVEIISSLNKSECSPQQNVDRNIRHHGEFGRPSARTHSKN